MRAVKLDLDFLGRDPFLIIGESGHGLILWKSRNRADFWLPVCRCCMDQKKQDSIKSMAIRYGVTRVFYDESMADILFSRVTFSRQELESMSQV